MFGRIRKQIHNGYRYNNQKLSSYRKGFKNIFEEIIGIQLNDNTVFLIKTIKPIREDDRYGGFRISIESHYDSIIVPISIDVTTGDVITPSPILRNFGSYNQKLWIA